MKRYFLFLILTMCFSIFSSAQKNDSKTNKPKEDIKVNREYDEQGNLIRFDSLHSYSWSGDTTMIKSFSPEDFQDLLGDHFNFFSDSASRGHSFFDDFDRFFYSPFSGKQDSILMKKFGMYPPFHFFGPDADSLAWSQKDFEDFFGNFGENKRDSISATQPFNSRSKSMDEMMKMFQEQMKRMEEQHRKFFEEQSR